jgi:hypothetical protein
MEGSAKGGGVDVKRRLFSVPRGVGVLLACVLLLAGTVNAFSSPVIEWDAKKIAVTLGNGQAVGKQVVGFTSGQELHNVVVWAVPALSEYVDVEPVSFNVIMPGTRYEIALNFRLPPDARPGRIEGTVHLRVGSRTVARPLRIQVDVDFGDIEISNRTRVLSGATLQYLDSVSPYPSRLVFSQSTHELQRLQVDDIIVIGVTPLTPEGFLGRVTGVSQWGGSVLVDTDRAGLEEVILSGTIRFSEHLVPDGTGTLSWPAPGTTASRQSLSTTAVMGIEPQGFGIAYEDVVLFDLDRDHDTTYDQIIADGFFYVDPYLDVRLQIQDAKVQYLRFVPTVTVSAKVEALARLELFGFDSKINIPVNLCRSCPPIIVWAGSVPLVFTLAVNPMVHAEGSVYAGLEASVAAQTTGRAGLEYVNDAFAPVVSLSTRFEFEPPHPTAGADFKAGFGANLSLKLYGIVGPYVAADKYLALEVDLFDDPWWTLFGGTEVFGGFRAGIPLITLFDWEFPQKFGERRLLASASATALETLVIPANGTVVHSRSYSSSSRYRLEVSGTYDWGGCDAFNCPGGGACNYRRYGDAEWLTDNCWNSVNPAFHGWDISVLVDGGPTDWGPYNRNHVYSILRSGNNGPFSFHILDCPPCYVDNSGYLTVNIFAMN